MHDAAALLLLRERLDARCIHGEVHLGEDGLASSQCAHDDGREHDEEDEPDRIDGRVRRASLLRHPSDDRQ